MSRKKGRSERKAALKESNTVPDFVPPFTTSLDAAIPDELIVSVQYDESSGKWIAINKSPNGALHVGVGNTEALARRIAGLRALDAKKNQAEQNVPASDRVVGVDHNSPHFPELVSVLAELIDTIKESNEYAANDPEDRDQRLIELESARDLLKRPGMIAVPMLVSILTYLGLKFADSVIGSLANHAFELLVKVIGG